MAIIEKTERRIVIDLTGPSGNAFVLLGHAASLGKQLGMDVKALTREMTSGDYEHLVQVFDEKFGDYVDLER